MRAAMGLEDSVMAGDDTRSLSSDHGSSSTRNQVAFKARLKEFEYSHPADMNGHRRSPRFANRPASVSTSGSAHPASSRRKQSLQMQTTKDDVKETDNLTDGVETGESSPRASPPRSKKRRSTTKERAAGDSYSPVNNLVDSLRPGLVLVFIGLNPGLMTAATGHAYAHPSNRFWHLIHSSGITPKKHRPSETRDLMDLYQIGNTNICARPTRSGDGLSKQELQEGAAILERKIAEFKPEAVVIVGKGIWEAIWMMKKGMKKYSDPNFHWGWQDEVMRIGRTKDADGNISWPGAKTFVATSTSGLAATLTPAEKLAIWKPLGDWMTAKREELRVSRATTGSSGPA